MKTILRFSVDGEADGSLRNKLTRVLQNAGFTLGANTATYEHPAITQAAMSDVLSRFWNKAASHDRGGRVDHFWLYSEADAAHNAALANDQAAAALGLDFDENE